MSVSLGCFFFLEPTSQKQKPKRVKAIYNCSADNPDELTFTEGEVIVVDGEEDQEWLVSPTDPIYRLVTTSHTLFLNVISSDPLTMTFCVLQVGHIEAEPTRRGVFPVTFVHFITD